MMSTDRVIRLFTEGELTSAGERREWFHVSFEGKSGVEAKNADSEARVTGIKSQIHSNNS